MRPSVLTTVLALVTLGAQAGKPYLDLTARTPTTVAVGGTVEFMVQFSQIQEGGSFDNGDGEPSPDIGIQQWRSAYRDVWQDTLTDLRLTLGATSAHGAPGVMALQRDTQPGALSGTDYTTSWLVTLRFDQPGRLDVLAGALATQQRYRYSEQTVRTRECVGFDNSLQCSEWPLQTTVLENTTWTETASALSLPVQVQVVPEPATTALWLAGLAGLALRARRRAG